MKRILCATGGAAAVAALVLASIASGSTSRPMAPVKSRIVIKERGSAEQTSDHTYKGRFVLLKGGVIQDSGTTIIVPSLEAPTLVDGQLQAHVSGYDNLTTKKGTLTMFFRGVSVVVASFDPTKDPFEIEYGTWRITGSTGIYKGWKGGGRWANHVQPTTNNIEWDGYVAG